MSTSTFMTKGVRVAIEGCGHGTLNAIYAGVKKSCEERGWDGVDLLIIGGDFQAVRNAADLNAMAVPAKYRELGDFHEYYKGTRKAPYLTIFIAGNHEASSHLWELYYGGWVAPNIYYMGAANVLRLGPLRIMGMSGIWKGFDYRKPHHERLPFNAEDVRSFYHVREIDVRKLLQLRTQVDVGLSHDWPRAIEKHGNSQRLFKMKPDFERESYDGSLGNPAAEYVLNRLRPPYWFSAHLHCKFAAIKEFPPAQAGPNKVPESEPEPVPEPIPPPEVTFNPDEIDLDVDDGDDYPVVTAKAAATTGSGPETQQTSEPTATTAPETGPAAATAEIGTDDTETLRAQLPEAFARRAVTTTTHPRTVPGQPVPETITNTTTRFLALDKCLPGRKFLQVMEIPPYEAGQAAPQSPSPSKPESKSKSRSRSRSRSRSPSHRLRLQYDPEWLSILRAFHPLITIGDRTATVPQDEGEAAYEPLIAEHRAWVDEHIVDAGRLEVPENFETTAPPHRPEVDREITQDLPREWTNPQTSTFCELLGVKNLWDASEEERKGHYHGIHRCLPHSSIANKNVTFTSYHVL
ncbi:lariat debranching enzyme, C-terminal domain-containing protein [Chaetomium sp. MPI-SDFR-AT-0129]|nr:lariat debranching enzyme, C-terminal domain-containing protein [Chaetomium sp. MPI-SDFR-AT-0129]